MGNKTLYGFRLDTLTVHHGHTRTPLGFSKETLARNGRTFLESLEDLRPALVGTTRIGPLVYERFPSPQTVMPGETSPAIRVERMDILATRVDFVVRVGRVGSHDLAIAASATDDASLQGKASTNQFNVSIYLPKAGNVAVVVSEVRSTSAAASQLLKLISVLSFEQAVQARDDSNTQWWRLTSKPVADSDRLREVLTQGRGAALQLKRLEASAGKGRAKTSITLRRNGLPTGALQSVQAMVLGWANLGTTNKGSAPKGTPVEQIAALIGVHVNTADFNDGSVTYDDAQGRAKEIRPTNISQIFIYPVAEGLRPTSHEIRVKAEERLRKLQGTLRIPLNI